MRASKKATTGIWLFSIINFCVIKTKSSFFPNSQMPPSAADEPVVNGGVAKEETPAEKFQHKSIFLRNVAPFIKKSEIHGSKKISRIIFKIVFKFKKINSRTLQGHTRLYTRRLVTGQPGAKIPATRLDHFSSRHQYQGGVLATGRYKGRILMFKFKNLRNLFKIILNMYLQIRGCDFGALVNRDIVKRVRNANGVAAHVSIAQASLC